MVPSPDLMMTNSELDAFRRENGFQQFLRSLLDMECSITRKFIDHLAGDGEKR
jgi:hypothetical protein